MCRRLGAHRGSLAIRARPNLELELLGEVHEVLELLLDELGVAGDSGTKRLAELAHGLELLVREPLAAQAVA
jgi:hypothetical protein